MTTTRIGPSSVCVLTLLAAGGCTPSTGKVSGTIAVDGKPLRNGQVLFFDPDQKQAAGAVTEGAYKVANAPVGHVKIAVRSFPPSVLSINPKDPQPAKKLEPSGPFIPLPEKYGDPETSGLTITVLGGAQKHDIQLPGVGKPGP